MAEGRKKYTAYIGLGSNLGDGLTTLRDAWRAINETARCSTVILSRPYLSAPVDMESSNWFTNAVGAVETDLAPEYLLDCLMEIESSFGRRRDPERVGYQDRSLDLDIIYFDSVVMNTPKLVLPHPCRERRLFVLQPLVEIAPDFRDPVDGMTVRQKSDALHRRMTAGTMPFQEISRGQW